MPYTEEFKDLRRKLFREYTGKKVPTKYQERYGKKYTKASVGAFAYAIANARGIKVH